MDILSIITVVGEIAVEGMKAWNESRRVRFKNKYHSILTKLERSKNKPASSWVDSDIDVFTKELEIFLLAYVDEIKNDENK